MQRVGKVVAAVLYVVAGVCVAIGSINMLYAADRWQAYLTADAHRFAYPRCPGEYSVTGWGDGFIFVATVLALAAIAVAAWGVLADSELTWPAIPLALPLTFALWVNAYAVSESPLGDCDGIGLTGSAAVAILRAGWLLFAAMPLLAGVFLWERSQRQVYSSAIPARHI